MMGLKSEKSVMEIVAIITLSIVIIHEVQRRMVFVVNFIVIL